MSEASFENLISAYLDDELSPGERARAEKLIAEDRSAAELLESLRAQSVRIKELPRFKLAGDFADRLMESPAFTEAVGSTAVASASGDRIVNANSTPVGRPLKWSMAAAAIGSLAALIFVTLVVNPASLTTNSNVAMNESADAAPAQAIAAGLDVDDAESEELARSEAPRQSMKTNGSLGVPESEAKAFKPDEISVDRSLAGEREAKRISDSDESALQSKSAAKLRRMDSKSGVSPSPGGIKSDAMQQSFQDAVADKMRTKQDALVRDAGLAKNKKSVRAGKAFGSKAAESDSSRFARAKENSLAESANVPKVAPSPLDAFDDSSNGVVDGIAGNPGNTTVGTVEHVIEIVLPGLNAAHPYDFAAFKASMSRNGIQVADANADAKTNRNAAQSNQALYVVASPNQMRGLVSELAANRVGISSFGFGSVKPGGDAQSQSAFGYQATKQSNIEFGEQSGSGAGVGGGFGGGGVVDGGGGGLGGRGGGAIASGGQPQQSAVPSRQPESLGQSASNEIAERPNVAVGTAVFGEQFSQLGQLTPDQIDRMVGADSDRDVAGQPRRYFFLVRRANSTPDSSLVPATSAPAIPSKPAGK